MAIVRTIAPFQGASGKFARSQGSAEPEGQVARPDSSGRTILRTHTVPANPRTTAQEANRSILGILAGLSKMMTDSQRQGWFDLADGLNRRGRMGFDVKLTWLQAFQSVNFYQYLRSGNWTWDAPSLDTANSATAITAIVYTATEPVDTIGVTLQEAPEPTPGGYVTFRFTPPLASSARRAQPNQFRYISTGTGAVIERDPSTEPTYQVPNESGLVLASGYYGVELTTLTPNGIPIARLVARNLEIST
jgi:hypothetical protein